MDPWVLINALGISAKSKLGEAIRYALTCGEGLSLFIDNSRVGSTTTPSSAPPVGSRSIVRTPCLPDLSKRATTGP
ncbi:hypothetical protein HNO88_004457 [Novosphingobium chloroacetimidivorans]|uniref:Uncharacterized protein n=1 Tax=Novosphingobium chloroacetimidivorans TaxID=1428314 RepID=A0A7W7KF77_9SPHN|nr:hypothetical protein [Novosphingobium chloroacetimidivorans]